MTDLGIAVLGPLVLQRDGRELGVPGLRLQRLLLRLAVEPGRTVPLGELSEAVWADDAPADPANALQSLVSRLRRVLADPALLRQVEPGYRLAVPPGTVDAELLAALPRHQAPWAVVAWSWELLTQAEPRLAERLSVFPAGASVPAAAEVFGGVALPEPG